MGGHDVCLTIPSYSYIVFGEYWTYCCSSPTVPSFGLPDKIKTRSGYGLTTEDLMYGSGEEFDEDEEDEEEDEDHDVDMSYLDLPHSDEDKASSSGESSPPSSATHSPVTIQPTTYVGASTAKISYIMDDDVPVSHERSTKDMSVLTKNEERMEQLKKRISESIMAAREKDLAEASEFMDMQSSGGPARPGVTIGSLMNKALDPTPRDESDESRDSGKRNTRKPLPECDFYIYDDLTLEDDEVEVIPKEKFQAATAKSSSELKSKQPIVIDDDEDDLFSEDEDDEMDECIDMEDGEQEEEEEEDEEEALSGDEQIEEDFEMKDKENVPIEHPTIHEETTNSHSHSVPPLGVMGSKLPTAHLDAFLGPPPPSKPNFRSSIEELTHAAVAAMQAPTPPPSATLPPLSKLHRETIIKKTSSGASHIHWLAENTPPAPKTAPFPGPYPDLQTIGIGSMDQKKEYFAAREFNRSRDSRSYRNQDDSHILCPPKSPAPLPYIINGMPWIHGSNSNEPQKETSGLFPNILEPEKTGPTASSMRTSEGITPPPTVSSQAKRLLEDAVADGEKIKACTAEKYWWPNADEEAEFEIDDDAEVQWDDDIANDEDGEYDEDDEEQNKGDEDEEDAANLGFDYEGGLVCDLADEQQDDDIRTDASEYGGGSSQMGQANDDASLPFQGIYPPSSSGPPPNNSHFVAASVPGAAKIDFTKSRGFSISNLVNENTTPTPRLQLAATGTFYPPRPLVDLPCRPIIQTPVQQTASNLTDSASASLASQAKKEKSMADLLNPSSPTAGCKRKHEEISNIFSDEVAETEDTDFLQSFDPDNMDETDDDLEEIEQKGNDKPTFELPANSTKEKQSLQTCSATTANIAVQVSATETIRAITENESETGSPRKKARTSGRRSRQVAKFAATALAGAIVGGVGMFAALVATAPAP